MNMIKEEEVEELVKKSQQLETELDWTNERLRFVTLQLEEKEKALLAAEAALKEERQAASAGLQFQGGV